jgi:hypothetical protein
MTVNHSFLLSGRQASNIFVLLLLCLLSMEIASDSGDSSVPRLMRPRHFKKNKPYLVRTTGNGNDLAEEEEEERNELIKKERKEQIRRVKVYFEVPMTEVSITFGYTIEYNNSANITNEEIIACLETATENLLLDSFNCSYGNDEDQQSRRLNTIDQIDSSTAGVGAGAGMVHLRGELERSAVRYLYENIDSFPTEAPSSAPTVGDGCNYTVSATVDSIRDIRT